MRKSLLTILLIGMGIGVSSILAQSNNLTDYGLTEESVKYLSEKEKQEILKSKTPAQSREYFKKGIQDGSIKSDEVPVPFLNLSNTASIKPDTPLSDEVVSCFDYYTFGSIEAPIQSRSSRTVSGTEITFFGDIINKNPYPVVEGTLYVKIMKNIGSVKNPNGPDVVDQFIAIDDVTLSANGSIPFEFKWKVPAYAMTGDYRVVTYFTSDKKFNLQGLSFTDDIIGNSFDFRVKGEQKEIIAFDKSSVVINDSPYYFAAYPPRIPKEKKADISLEVFNDTQTNQNTHIQWRLYKWDAMNPENLVREFTTNTETKANAKTTVKLEIPEDSEPVYLLVGELNYEDTKSILNIRYVRDGVDKVRLNYPAVTSYPLKQGEQTTLFTCLHNSGQSPQVQNNTVTLEVLNETGKVVESYTYEGVVTGDMMAVKKDFIPKTNLGTFSVHASLYTDGKLVDESVMKYSCNDLDPTKCIQDTIVPIGTNVPTLQIIIGLIVLVALLLVLIFIKRRTKGIELMIILFALISSIFLFGVSVKSIYAQHTQPLPADLVNPSITGGSSQVVWNTVINETLITYWNRFYWTGWATVLANPDITVRYNTKITDADGIEMANTSTVNPGDSLRFHFIPHHPYDIFWFGTGYSADSPYGEWRNGAVPSAVSCPHKDFVNILSEDGMTFANYISIVVAPPVKTISHTNGLTCGNLSGDEASGYFVDCTVKLDTSDGTVLNPQLNFDATLGNFYYRYYDFRSGTTWGDSGPITFIPYCYGSNVALGLYNGMCFYDDEIQECPPKNNKSYNLQVPPQSITYNLTVVVPPSQNQPPTISIAGPTAGVIATSYSFTFTADDPDTDKVKIEIDWDNDDTGDIFLPSAAEEFVISPTTQTSSKQWSTVGGKTFKARAIDEHGVASAWSSHTIILTNAPINGVCGSAHNKIYPPTRMTYSPDIQCAEGSPSNTAFPAIGAATTWTCSGQYEGNPSGPCTASITAPVDMCANIEDNQTTIPAGLNRIAGNCVCSG